MEEMMEIIRRFGGKEVLLGLCVVIVTELIKIPIKKIASRTENPASIMRYISLVPFAVGALVAAVSGFMEGDNFLFERDFTDRWLCCSGLGVALYSCFVNFRDSSKKTFSDDLKNTLYVKLLELLGDKKKSAVLAERTAGLLRAETDDDLFMEEVYTYLKEDLSREESDKIAGELKNIYSEMKRTQEAVVEQSTESYEYERCSHTLTTRREEKTESNLHKEENK